MLLAGVPLNSKGQEGVYYFGPNSKPVELLKNAASYKEVIRRSEKKFIIEIYQRQGNKWVKSRKEKIKIKGDGIQTIYYHGDGFFPKRIYREMKLVGQGDYLFKETNLTSTLRTGTSTSFLPLHLEGSVTEYHPNGEIKSISLFHDNQLISNENWLNDGSRYLDSVFYSVDEEPEYQMGDDFFKAFLINKLAESKLDLTQIEDQVVIGWVVMETGKIDGVIALKGKSSQLNEILVNTIIELPGYWTPALLDGLPVRYFMSIPLNFIQREANFQEIEFSSGVMHYNRY